MGVGWGSSVRLLLRDRATASWGWGKGVIAIAADCVTVELRIGAGRGGWGGAVTSASYCVPVQLRPGTGKRGPRVPSYLGFFSSDVLGELRSLAPRKAVKTRPNGRNNSRGKLKGRYYSVKKP